MSKPLKHFTLDNNESNNRVCVHTYTKQIIEGTITIGFGIIAWFFLPNFPDQNIFLTREETRLILQRVEEDRGDSIPDVLTKEKLLSHLLDWKVWTFGMTSFFLNFCSLIGYIMFN